VSDYWQTTPMDEVRADEGPAELMECGDGRVLIRCFTQGGFDNTTIDLADLLGWLRRNRPKLLETK
jgi:hypothetical protein